MGEVPQPLVQGPFPASHLMTFLGGGAPVPGSFPLPSLDRRVSTCWEAGNMPLAFTQEDFLVIF